MNWIQSDKVTHNEINKHQAFMFSSECHPVNASQTLWLLLKDHDGDVTRDRKVLSDGSIRRFNLC